MWRWQCLVFRLSVITANSASSDIAADCQCSCRLLLVLMKNDESSSSLCNSIVSCNRRLVSVVLVKVDKTSSAVLLLGDRNEMSFHGLVVFPDFYQVA